ncbi:hypothetical protein N5079_08740 [Planotetraspora sp. A-T 1434]|uniref:hypothetical protein n=1 Tax=Planotetraspora sp. A-T 1434 TaxID=2979219 RepID=UPI0021C1D4E7|nr:hypothetical protein [Planotetraspora sp. A-T 1434]MCT9930310.1 hypothetical protein [Planotetraspora sp. A-T 1434]
MAPPAHRPAPSTREDLRAIIATRRELGPEYEDALVDSFLDKLDVEIAARVRNEVAAQMIHRPQQPPRKDAAVGVALGSLGIGIPLTGIAAGNAGTTGLVLSWAGIIAVNLAYAISRRSSR